MLSNSAETINVGAVWATRNGSGDLASKSASEQPWWPQITDSSLSANSGPPRFHSTGVPAQSSSVRGAQLVRWYSIRCFQDVGGTNATTAASDGMNGAARSATQPPIDPPTRPSGAAAVTARLRSITAAATTSVPSPRQSSGVPSPPSLPLSEGTKAVRPCKPAQSMQVCTMSPATALNTPPPPPGTWMTVE